jgi:hypothetical protein
MPRLFVGAIAVTLLLLAGDDASSQDKKEKKAVLSGTWAREANGLDVKFEFSGNDTVKVSVFGGDNGIIATCKHTVDKDGLVKAKITKVEEKGTFEAKPPVGLEFSFKWKVKGDTATLDELKGEMVEDAKPVLEGEYERKKK